MGKWKVVGGSVVGGFNKNHLKQHKVTFTHKQVEYIYAIYEIHLWPFNTVKYFAFENSLFGSVKLTLKC